MQSRISRLLAATGSPSLVLFSSRYLSLALIDSNRRLILSPSSTPFLRLASSSSAAATAALSSSPSPA